MKNLSFYGDVAKALEGINKKFDLKITIKNKLLKKVDKHKIALIVTSLAFIIPASGFINFILELIFVCGSIKCLKNILWEPLKETLSEKKKIINERNEAKKILHRFNGKALKGCGINLNENKLHNCMKNIGVYSKKELKESVRIKREEKFTKNYIKMKDTKGKIHVLKQIKKEILEDGESIKELPLEYQLLTINEANIQLKKERGKLR